jgi:tRNA-specific 2-thiouridylase
MTAPDIVVGMSGGVDSAVAALLLKRAGYRVTGLFMKNWEDDDDAEYCSTREDLVDAAAAADVIGIDFEAVNFSAEYKDRVFAEFLREYSAGRTPNPDVLCNAEIKFRAFLDHAMTLGAGRIATGHYAGVRERDGRFELLRAADRAKDQSYFLHRLTQEQLSRVMFPLSAFQKPEVRRIAAEAGLANHAKKDSTGICFIGERPFREFLNRYLPKKPGAILDERGRRIGEHIGLMFYTIGQRKGIGLGGMRGDAGAADEGAPWFVAAKDVAANTITVVRGHDHPMLRSIGLVATGAAWAAGEPPAAGSRLTVKTRYRQEDGPCRLVRADSGGDFALDFEVAQWAVTPGQSAVLYDGEVCLGGGFIEHAVPAALDAAA